MLTPPVLLAASALHGSSHASFFSEQLGLIVLLVSVLGIVLNAVRLNEVLEESDNRGAHKLKRWPIALRSLSSGLAVAYVFMLLIPELTLINDKLSGKSLNAMALALAGLLLFNGIQHFCLHRATAAHESMGDWKFVGVRRSEKRSNFMINISVFVVYAALILLTLPFQFSHLGGYGMSRILYVITFVLHLGFDALAVSEEDPERFFRLAIRFVAPVLVAAAVIASTALLSNLILLAAFSLLTGIVMYQVFRIEVKGAGETSFVWFVCGALLFVVLHMLTFEAAL